MVQCSATRLDLSFAALSDGTRRGILDLLARGEASISSLAKSFRMSLTGVRKHVDVLETAGLVVTRKTGRVRTCALRPEALAVEAEWIETRRRLFAARFEALDEVLDTLQQEIRHDVDPPGR